MVRVQCWAGWCRLHHRMIIGLRTSNNPFGIFKNIFLMGNGEYLHYYCC
jgi:hypothetical protein